MIISYWTELAFCYAETQLNIHGAHDDKCLTSNDCQKVTYRRGSPANLKQVNLSDIPHDFCPCVE